MILRRIITHFRKQEWTAIGIDFVIVVLGVFVATQVTDWNNQRLERDEYRRALARLDTEITANIETISTNLPEIERALGVANHALDVLQTCRHSAENVAAIDAGLMEIRGTSTLPLRRRALEDLTSNASLLAHQTAEERQRFADLLDYMLLFEQEMRFAELHPLAERVKDNPAIAIGPIEQMPWTYAGVEYTRERRSMRLAVPVSRACHNDRLVKSFFTWTRWQSNLPLMGRRARDQLEATQGFLAER
jgi:hypothetical protein